MATVIAVTSDQHAGSTIALCPARIDLDDGGAYVASTAQRWLWGHWEGYWEWVARLRERHGTSITGKGSRRVADLYAVFNGDLTEGYHHGTTQILTANPTAQAAVVDAIMRVPLSLGLDKLFFVRGTEAHVGKSAAYEERVATGLQKDGRDVIGCPDTGTASWWHLRMCVDGVRLDFAHHGRIGTRPWTKGNVVLNLAAQIFYDHAANGEPHPHIAVRSHFHQHFDTYDAHPTRVIQTPAWQLATAHVHRIATESIADVGGVAIVIEDGRAEVHNYVHRPARGAVWTA